MKCKECKEKEGEMSMLDELGDVQLLCFFCSDRREWELLQESYSRTGRTGSSSTGRGENSRKTTQRDEVQVSQLATDRKTPSRFPAAPCLCSKN